MAEKFREDFKKRFLRNEAALDDEELLALLISTVASPKKSEEAAKALLQRFPNLYALLRAPSEDWETVSGVNADMVTLLRAVRQLERRSVPTEMPCSGLDMTVRDLGEFIRPYFRHTNVEEAYLLCLDGALHTIGCYQLGTGSANAVMISPASVVKVALDVGASACVLAHNHPSAVAEFSTADQTLTEQVFFALDAVEIVLLDHVVLASDELISMEQRGCFKHLYDKRTRGIMPFGRVGRIHSDMEESAQTDSSAADNHPTGRKNKTNKKIWDFFE